MRQEVQKAGQKEEEAGQEASKEEEEAGKEEEEAGREEEEREGVLQEDRQRAEEGVPEDRQSGVGSGQVGEGNHENHQQDRQNNEEIDEGDAQGEVLLVPLQGREGLRESVPQGTGPPSAYEG